MEYYVSQPTNHLFIYAESFPAHFAPFLPALFITRDICARFFSRQLLRALFFAPLCVRFYFPALSVVLVYVELLVFHFVKDMERTFQIVIFKNFARSIFLKISMNDFILGTGQNLLGTYIKNEKFRTI